MSSSTWTKTGLAAAGLVAGVVLASTLGAQAATSTPSPATTSGAAGSATAPPPGVPDGGPWHHGFRHMLGKAGTVTAVGAASVTIKDAGGTATTYAVTSGSDIDKNGEATLSDLKTGDAVRFSTDAAGKAIDKLHAGDEAKDRPMGPPPADAPGAPAQGSSTSGSSSTAPAAPGA